MMVKQTCFSLFKTMFLVNKQIEWCSPKLNYFQAGKCPNEIRKCALKTISLLNSIMPIIIVCPIVHLNANTSYEYRYGEEHRIRSIQTFLLKETSIPVVSHFIANRLSRLMDATILPNKLHNFYEALSRFSFVFFLPCLWFNIYTTNLFISFCALHFDHTQHNTNPYP